MKYAPSIDKYPDGAIVYCHGGAFRYGRSNDDASFLTALSETTQMCVYSADFRNIDDARSIRGMVDDVISMINCINNDNCIKKIHMMGSSSGGYIAWITSMLLNNPERFGIKTSVNVESVTLISGFLLFNENDSITQYFRLFPAFQTIREIKDIDTDYSDYTIARTLLITGDDDTCLIDSKTLHARLLEKDPNLSKLIIVSSDEESVEHCFLTEHPDSNISRNTLKEIKEFIYEENTC